MVSPRRSGITWADIRYSFSSTAKIPLAALQTVLERMEAAWQDNDGDMAKLSVNAMIGLWATDERYVYSCRTSRHTEDGIGAHAKRHVVSNSNDTLFGFI